MPQPDENVRDPRVKRTRLLLQDGLRKALHEKPFHEVLVQDIADAATVNRATFYDHYIDKFDLFNALIAADFQKLLEQRKVCFGDGSVDGITATVMAVGDFLQGMHGDQKACTQQASSGPLIDAAIALAIRRIVLSGLDKRSHGTSQQRAVLASLVSGAIYSAVKESMSHSNWHADEANLRTVVQLMMPLVRSNKTDGPVAIVTREKVQHGSKRKLAP